MCNATGVTKSNVNVVSDFDLIKQRAENGDAAAQYELGVSYENIFGNTHDFSKAFQLFTASAQQGNADAQCKLGNYYEQGRGGIGKNPTEALKWYNLAADQGHPNALCCLGEFHQFGFLGDKSFVDVDVTKAFELYKKAADQGHSRAILNLGKLYLNGDGVNKDSDKAIELFRQVAVKDDRLTKIAKRYLGEVYNKIGDIVSAREWYGQAADMGDEKSVEILKKL